MINAESSTACRERRIALLKPAVIQDERMLHALQLLGSMIWAFKGSTSSTWITVPPEEADVVVAPHDHEDEQLEAWRASGKRILKISFAHDCTSSDKLVLIYPFRAAHAHALLEELDCEMSGGTSTRLRLLASNGDSEWSAIEMLRSFRSRPGGRWFTGFKAETPVLWLSSNAATYCADTTTAEAIRAGWLRLNELDLREESPPPQELGVRSGMELAWFAGYHASDELAPGLDPTARFRIKRWPNFSAIRPASTQVRIATAMVAAEIDISEIVSRVSVSREEASRTLNALAACDVIVAGTSKAITTLEIPILQPERRHRLGNLLRNVRKHLGLGL